MFKLVKNQNILLEFAIKNDGKVSRQKAVEIIGNDYDKNCKKRVGHVLERLVNDGKLNRLRPGYFEVKK